MKLHIQDPGNADSPFLQEKILELCQSATFGAGAFAFVTAEGVKLLLGDDIFEDFLRRGKFELIVGVDAITNPAALAALKARIAEFRSLDVKVFLNDRKQTTFHPKFCWFTVGHSTLLLIGSGNLTFKGLRGNWEAFGVGELQGDAASAVQSQWAGWRSANSSRLRRVDDPDVVAKAEANVRRAELVVAAEEEAEAEPPAAAPPTLKPMPEIRLTGRVDDVLIAEIPRAGDRWNQANFNLETFRNYFGAEPGILRRIVLQHVESNGDLGTVENRQSVSVVSQNYRFELDAASGLRYPSSGRPIAVFVRIAARTFRYRLVMPSDPNHSILDALLRSLWKGPSSRMRRVVTNSDLLKEAWPNAPLWVKPLEVQDPSVPVQNV
jgi:hypothetical protein